ncbi:MAG TPA: sigma 54-interacting transcriptional regulator [Pyrinomonadaceae bacterium]|nr:sigma 54-interacting transcriptional regulator [Pyrinomonadaceae bacterium]
MDLSQYRLETLRQDGEFILYRCLRRTKSETTPPSLLALAPVWERPAAATIKKIEHEFSFKDELDSEWAVRPITLIQQQRRTMLLFADPNGQPLDQLLQLPLELKQFLRCGIALAAALGQMHRRGLVHKNIKPSNLLANVAMDQVWLMGFGIASRLPRQRQPADPPESISGTLAYMAPEQTGRMNRSIDSRSDLYAFGITLYELLTGSLPFTASDPMEWIHAHIARQPLPPAARRKDIPASVSAIICKLLAKTPEERYQTAAGVESDLRRCLTSTECEQSLPDFPLGEHDRPDHLVIPEKLYGREREIETLLACFDRVVENGKPELVLVSGYSGIGKSSVVNELHKVLVPPRGLFASGKFDQYKRDIPYATLAQAFQGLIRQLLGKSEAELDQWRESFHEVLGANGQLMVDLVPELKLIIGEQTPVPELPPARAQHRFQLVFRRFIGAFARPEHPLALFLDDLQWLDAATLNLFEDLMIQRDVQYLLLIGAYRDNEVDSTHPLIRKLDAVRGAGVLVHEIILAPLGRENLGRLIGDAIRTDPGSVAPLAQLVHDKTGGNPFFAIQFLAALAEERLLAYEGDSWSWEVERIHAKGYTDNVVDLMVHKLGRLPVNTQLTLRQLACLGNIASTATLALVQGSSAEQADGDLWEAVRQELIERLHSSYKFMHDRIQEAAYSLIPEESRPGEHLRIGRLLLRQTPSEEREESIFDIVNQLNRGAALIPSRGEREELAELDLIAGKRAKASTAYAAALNYLQAGVELLPDDRWRRCHELTFALELNRAECEFLTGNMAAAEKHLSELSRFAAGAVEEASVACVRIDVYIALARSDDAIEIALDYLRRRGIDWSPHPTQAEVQAEYERIWSLLGTREIEQMRDLPTMHDPESLATLDVIMKLVVPANFTDKNLFSLAACKTINLSLEKGKSDGAWFACTWVATIAGPGFGDYKASFRFGQLGYEQVEQRDLKRFQPACYFTWGGIVLTWRKHYRDGREPLRRAFAVANEIGDVNFALFSSSVLISNLLAAGDPLAEVQHEAELNLVIAQNARFEFMVDLAMALLGLIRTLRGLTPTFGRFNDGNFDEGQFEHHLSTDRGVSFPRCWYWIRKLQARFFAGDYRAALDAAARAEVLLWSQPTELARSEHSFFSALAHAASCDPANSDEGAQHLEAMAGRHRHLEILAENCPENYAHRAALVGAEIARLEHHPLAAMDLYERALRFAKANGFVHDEALTYERAAVFHRARGCAEFAELYLRNARACYASWGADGKVRQLDQLYPDLQLQQPVPDPTSTITALVEGLDLATVIRVSQAVSGEIVPEKLLDTVMRKAMEHAGADRGLLIVPHCNRLQVKAEATTDGDTVSVRALEESDSFAALPESVLRYVQRTHEQVIIDDASVPNSFATDEYLHEQRTRSVACLPLLKQGELVALLYLENKLASNVFTPARLKILEVLASQAAISLENSRLYHEIQQAEEAVRRSEKQLRDVLETMPAMAFTVLSDGSTEFVNHRFTEYTGLKAEEVRSHRRTLIHPEDFDGYVDKWKVSIASGELFESEVRGRGADGQYRWFLVRGVPLRNEQGAILKWFGTLTDIEDRKQEEERLRNENVVLREEIVNTSMFEEIVGTSAALQGVLAQVAKVAPTDSTVLITGETGTGKELIARAIHKNSHRSGHAFVAVNCAAIPRELIASELFGHEKGAFTGATQQRLGRFELANGGTIFLDEVGELPAETQVALLRVLQEREFERVGGTRRIRVDVRVITATNRDLEVAICSGIFRRDLYYRLLVFPIEIPSLRHRSEDIPLLVEYFIDRFARKAGKNIRSVEKKTLELLQSYSWPGNIRELQNVIERSIILCDTDVFSIDKSWLPRQVFRTASEVQVELPERLLAQEKDMIEAALKESHGRVFGPLGAAARLGIPRSTLESKIKALKIDKNRFKVANPS